VKSKSHIPAGDNFFDMPSYLNFLTSKKNHIIENIIFGVVLFRVFLIHQS